MLETVLSRSYRAVSKQAIYKELGKLEDKGLVVKVKMRYALRLTWLSELSTFIEEAYDTYLDAPLHFLLPVPGSKYTWQFNDLRRMDLFHTQLILTLHKATKEKQMYTWVPHPWYGLSHATRELEFWRATKKEGIAVYMIIGGDTPLDVDYQKFVRRAGVECSLAPGPFDSERRRYFNVIGNFVLTSTLSTTKAKAIDDLFRSTARRESPPAETVDRLLRRPVRITLMLEHNPAKARSLLKRFSVYFGLK
jgi:hypothetical protein